MTDKNPTTYRSKDDWLYLLQEDPAYVYDNNRELWESFYGSEPDYSPPPANAPGMNADEPLAAVGKSGPINHAGIYLATGVGKFNSDLKMPGMLYGKCLGCPYPHAKIKSIDTSLAEALPGVHAVITYKDADAINDKYTLNGPLPTRKVLQDETHAENPRPILVATCDRHIVGFTGPVDKQKSGRGWFTGICTDPKFERRGIATVLFNLLMQEFIAEGATFSTLFTGNDNHAQRVYLRAGFRIARRFVIMERAL
jgi:ribosomal protein S18 acetylase RimI-like enzyme